MTGPEHYKTAEKLLDEVVGMNSGDPLVGVYVQAAQVHATLALAAATAYPAMRDWGGDEVTDGRDWDRVAS